MRIDYRLGCGLLAAAVLALAACNQDATRPAPRVPAAPVQPDTGSDTGGLLKARSVRVQDGDSFVARLEDGRPLTIRLSGIDAPEKNQAHADRSRQSLRRLLDDRELRVKVIKTDAYGRAVAQVFVAADGATVDVGLRQVQDGMAWFFRRYRNDLPTASRDRYEEAEQKARESMRGLWQVGDPQPPWEYRRRPEANEPAMRR